MYNYIIIKKEQEVDKIKKKPKVKIGFPIVTLSNGERVDVFHQENYKHQAENINAGITDSYFIPSKNPKKHSKHS